MKTLKFDEEDRRKVIAEIEGHFATKLSRVGRFRKFLRDASGKSYWILGGYEDWHGISSDMMSAYKKRPNGGVLVIAKRGSSSIDIFAGDLQVLVTNERDLSHTQSGDYQFNVSIIGNTMTVKEISSLTLRKLGPTHDVGVPILAIFKKMTPAERQRLFKAAKVKQEV